MHGDHEKEGFELGWDIARLGYNLFAGTRIGACVEKGIAAGHAHFGSGVPSITCRYQRKVMQSRISAHRRKIQFSVDVVNADFLKRIDVEYCPITRVRLTHSTGLDTDWSVDRIDNRRGYIAGNLAIMSTAANREKDTLDFEALAAVTTDHTLQPRHDCALPAEAWQRLWTLSSFALTVPEADIHAWPMVICPPNWAAMAPAWEIKRCMSDVGDFGPPPGVRDRDIFEGKKELRAVAAFAEAKRYANGRAFKSLKAAHRMSHDDVSQSAGEDAWREALVNHTYGKALQHLSSASKNRLVNCFRSYLNGVA